VTVANERRPSSCERAATRASTIAITSIDSADASPNRGGWTCWAKKKIWVPNTLMPAGRPRISGVSNSWSPIRKPSVATARRFGLSRPSSMVRAVRSRPAPLICAASSSERSTAMNGPISSRYANAADFMPLTAIRPGQERTFIGCHASWKSAVPSRFRPPAWGSPSIAQPRAKKRGGMARIRTIIGVTIWRAGVFVLATRNAKKTPRTVQIVAWETARPRELTSVVQLLRSLTAPWRPCSVNVPGVPGALVRNAPKITATMGRTKRKVAIRSRRSSRLGTLWRRALAAAMVRPPLSGPRLPGAARGRRC
jgi:hypothetical protein